jgi:hypothetical protein
MPPLTNFIAPSRRQIPTLEPVSVVYLFAIDQMIYGPNRSLAFLLLDFRHL